MNREFGERLADGRKALKLTQEALSEVSGIPLSTLKKYEGSHREPGAEAIAALAKTGLNLHWLLTGTGEMILGTNQWIEEYAHPVGDSAGQVNDAGATRSNQVGPTSGPGVDSLLLEEVISVFFGWLDEHADRIRVDRDRYAAIIAVLYRIAASSGKAEKQELEQVLRAAA